MPEQRSHYWPGQDRETEPAEDSPHGWIQWKGTDLCMDVHCACGALGHVDAEFAYYVKCQACGRIYRCNPHIELVPLTAEEQAREEEITMGIVWAHVEDEDMPDADLCTTDHTP